MTRPGARNPVAVALVVVAAVLVMLPLFFLSMQLLV